MKKMKLAPYSIYIVLMIALGSTLIYAYDKNERIDYGMLPPLEEELSMEEEGIGSYVYAIVMASKGQMVMLGSLAGFAPNTIL